MVLELAESGAEYKRDLSAPAMYNAPVSYANPTPRNMSLPVELVTPAFNFPTPGAPVANPYANIKWNFWRQNVIPTFKPSYMNEYGGFDEYGGFSNGMDLSEDNPYLFIPDFSGKSKGVYVREDYFDYLTEPEFQQLLWQIMPFQPEVQKAMSEGLEKGKKKGGDVARNRGQRRQERKDKRAAKEKRKMDKNERKNKKAEATAALKAAKGQAKLTKAQGGGGGGSNILDTVVDGLSTVLGGKKKEAEVETETPGTPGKGGDKEETKILGMSPLAFGLTAAGVATAGYFIIKATQGRKRKRAA